MTGTQEVEELVKSIQHIAREGDISPRRKNSFMNNIKQDKIGTSIPLHVIIRGNKAKTNTSQQ